MSQDVLAFPVGNVHRPLAIWAVIGQDRPFLRRWERQALGVGCVRRYRPPCSHSLIRLLTIPPRELIDAGRGRTGDDDR